MLHNRGFHGPGPYKQAAWDGTKAEAKGHSNPSLPLQPMRGRNVWEMSVNSTMLYRRLYREVLPLFLSLLTSVIFLCSHCLVAMDSAHLLHPKKRMLSRALGPPADQVLSSFLHFMIHCALKHPEIFLLIVGGFTHCIFSFLCSNVYTWCCCAFDPCWTQTLIFRSLLLASFKACSVPSFLFDAFT